MKATAHAERRWHIRRSRHNEGCAAQSSATGTCSAAARGISGMVRVSSISQERTLATRRGRSFSRATIQRLNPSVPPCPCPEGREPELSWLGA